MTSGGRSDSSPTQFLDIGRVVAPFGLAGEVRVLSLTDFPQRFAKLRRVLVGDAHRACEIQRTRSARGQVLLKLRGVDDANAAEALRGEILRIPLGEAVSLPDDQFFWYQVIGLEVVTVGGERLGRVADILRTGANDVYIIRGLRGELLIPAIEDVVKVIDVDAGRLVVELMPGLVDDKG
jgi:16S rRNA processing protein RimM